MPQPITIPVDARVGSRLDYEIVKLSYLWRFYQSDKVQLSAGAGLHVTDVGLELDTETTSSDRSARRGSTSIPLPVVSLDVNYSISPKWAWYLKAELFALSFDDLSGTYSDLLVGAEYRAWKPVGIGLALNSNSLRVVEEKPDTGSPSRTGSADYYSTYAGTSSELPLTKFRPGVGPRQVSAVLMTSQVPRSGRPVPVSPVTAEKIVVSRPKYRL